MNPLLSSLEKALIPVFKGFTPLPKAARLWLVKALPYFALFFGVLQVAAVWGLWNLGNRANDHTQYVNEIARSYGIETASSSLGLFYWLALLALIVDAFILLLAYTGLADRKKRGWDLLFLGVILDLCYGVFAVFDTRHGGIGGLISSAIGAAIGLYLLFQVREYYLQKHTRNTI